MDYATRYPEALPLRTVDAKTVSVALMEVFSGIGIPQELLTDQGSNFLSVMMTQLFNLLGIKHLKTSPYHPQTDGMVERFNGSLKSMIQKKLRDGTRCYHTCCLHTEKCLML